MIGNEALDSILQARKHLDQFNSDIAAYRLGGGMNLSLKILYRKMGKLDAALDEAARLADMTQEVANLP